MSAIALHCSPHPDDELIGAPATLMALRDAGWRVVNLACGLGAPEQRQRREAELREACRRAGLELRIPALADPLECAIGDAIEELGPQIVLSPGPHELHPTHVAVAAAVRRFLAGLGEGSPRWWMWPLWGSLRQPTLATGFDRDRLEEILAALAAHEGELERNDYRRLVAGRAATNAALAPELLFGFGAVDRVRASHAEILTEALVVDGRWRLTQPRWLDPASPLGVASEFEALVE